MGHQRHRRKSGERLA
ncbi:hypothetical protein PO124_23280 [Bacillus licheniformis]|nr:hypothetical protein [Bacillus licheniformis]